MFSDVSLYLFITIYFADDIIVYEQSLGASLVKQIIRNLPADTGDTGP